MRHWRPVFTKGNRCSPPSVCTMSDFLHRQCYFLTQIVYWSNVWTLSQCFHTSYINGAILGKTENPLKAWDKTVIQILASSLVFCSLTTFRRFLEVSSIWYRLLYCIYVRSVCEHWRQDTYQGANSTVFQFYIRQCQNDNSIFRNIRDITWFGIDSKEMFNNK